MRLNINVAARPFVNMKPWAALLLVVLLALGLFSFHNVYRLADAGARRQRLVRALAAQRKNLDAIQESQKEAQESMASARRKRIQDEARFASRLVRQHGLSWTALFNNLEVIIPRDVRILSVFPEIAGNRITLRMECAARDNEAKLAFLQELYTAPFDDPYLLNEEFIEKGIRFQIKCSYNVRAADTEPGGQVGAGS